jgi:hypothetical protein
MIDKSGTTPPAPAQVEGAGPDYGPEHTNTEPNPMQQSIGQQQAGSVSFKSCNEQV